MATQRTDFSQNTQRSRHESHECSFSTAPRRNAPSGILHYNTQKSTPKAASVGISFEGVHDHHESQKAPDGSGSDLDFETWFGELVVKEHLDCNCESSFVNEGMYNHVQKPLLYIFCLNDNIEEVNSQFFGGKLDGRVCWEWSSELSYLRSLRYDLYTDRCRVPLVHEIIPAEGFHRDEPHRKFLREGRQVTLNQRWVGKGNYSERVPALSPTKPATREIKESPQLEDCIGYEQSLIGRRRLASWMHSQGRAKDWRKSAYAKINTKRQRFSRYILSCDVPSSRPKQQAMMYSGTHPPNLRMCLPRTLLRTLERVQTRWLGNLKPRQRKRIEYGAATTRLRKAKRGGGKQFKESCGTAADASEAMKEERVFQEEDLGIYVTPAQSYQQQLQRFNLTESRLQPDPKDILLIFNYQGEIINCPDGLLRIMEHLRSEPHGEVYAMEDLNLGLRYEVKIYVLRGVHPSQRKRRVENLKKMTSLPLFLYSFDHNDKKYCVFLPREPGLDKEAPPLKLGGICRRNTPEYRKAFPKLASPTKSGLAGRKIPDSTEPRIACTSENAQDLCVLKILNEEVSNSRPDLWEPWSKSHPPISLGGRILIRISVLDYWREELNAILGRETAQTQKDTRPS